MSFTPVDTRYALVKDRIVKVELARWQDGNNLRGWWIILNNKPHKAFDQPAEANDYFRDYGEEN